MEHDDTGDGDAIDLGLVENPSDAHGVTTPGEEPTTASGERNVVPEAVAIVALVEDTCWVNTILPPLLQPRSPSSYPVVPQQQATLTRTCLRTPSLLWGMSKPRGTLSHLDKF